METTYFVLFDATGRLRRTIPGGTMLSGRPGVATAHVKRQLEIALAKMGLPTTAGKLRDVRLPDVQGRGVRLFVRLPDHEYPAYRVPVVKAIAFEDKDWAVLSFPKEKWAVPAASLKPWLADLFPPAMKEMVGANIRNEEFKGTLQLSPAGADAKFRYAVLTGDVQLILAGRTRVNHSGKFAMLLTYPLDRDAVTSAKGIYEGTYPESDPRQGQTTPRRFVAAFESRPE